MTKPSRIGALLATLALATSLVACDKMNAPRTGTSTSTTSPSGPASAASQ